MVVPLGPGKFYGKSLPRPRIYTDVRFSAERVDPPAPLLEPLLSWASEAHWSMGGLSFNRLRLQGRIEGSVSKLRSHRHSPISGKIDDHKPSVVRSDDSPPPAPIASKRRRFMVLVDNGNEEDDAEAKIGESIRSRRRRLVKKLGDDFDRVASEKSEVKAKAVSVSARRQIFEDDDDVVVTVAEMVNKGKSKGKRGTGWESGPGGLRSSPRLAKRLVL